MITPADIENKDFSRVKRGYDMEEVDDFLDLIIVDMRSSCARTDSSRKRSQRRRHTQISICPQKPLYMRH